MIVAVAVPLGEAVLVGVIEPEHVDDEVVDAPEVAGALVGQAQRVDAVLKGEADEDALVHSVPVNHNPLVVDHPAVHQALDLKRADHAHGVEAEGGLHFVEGQLNAVAGGPAQPQAPGARRAGAGRDPEVAREVDPEGGVVLRGQRAEGQPFEVDDLGVDPRAAAKVYGIGPDHGATGVDHPIAVVIDVIVEIFGRSRVAGRVPVIAVSVVVGEAVAVPIGAGAPDELELVDPKGVPAGRRDHQAVDGLREGQADEDTAGQVISADRHTNVGEQVHPAGARAQPQVSLPVQNDEGQGVDGLAELDGERVAGRGRHVDGAHRPHRGRPPCGGGRDDARAGFKPQPQRPVAIAEIRAQRGVLEVHERASLGDNDGAELGRQVVAPFIRVGAQHSEVVDPAVAVIVLAVDQLEAGRADRRVAVVAVGAALRHRQVAVAVLVGKVRQHGASIDRPRSGEGRAVGEGGRGHEHEAAGAIRGRADQRRPAERAAGVGPEQHEVRVAEQAGAGRQGRIPPGHQPSARRAAIARRRGAHDEGRRPTQPVHREAGPEAGVRGVRHQNNVRVIAPELTDQAAGVREDRHAAGAGQQIAGARRAERDVQQAILIEVGQRDRRTELAAQGLADDDRPRHRQGRPAPRAGIGEQQPEPAVGEPGRQVAEAAQGELIGAVEVEVPRGDREAQLIPGLLAEQHRVGVREQVQPAVGARAPPHEHGAGVAVHRALRGGADDEIDVAIAIDVPCPERRPGLARRPGRDRAPVQRQGRPAQLQPRVRRDRLGRRQGAAVQHKDSPGVGARRVVPGIADDDLSEAIPVQIAQQQARPGAGAAAGRPDLRRGPAQGAAPAAEPPAEQRHLPAGG